MLCRLNLRIYFPDPGGPPVHVAGEIDYFSCSVAVNVGGEFASFKRQFWLRRPARLGQQGALLGLLRHRVSAAALRPRQC